MGDVSDDPVAFSFGIGNAGNMILPSLVHICLKKSHFARPQSEPYDVHQLTAREHTNNSRSSGHKLPTFYKLNIIFVSKM
jgi:hypothetical protein